MKTLIWYPKCSTCRKAKNYLEAKQISFQTRDIKEDVPTKEELKELYKKSGLPLKRFFNTSGLIYKEMKLKDKLPELSEEEQLELLASNGMLVKRPIFIDDHHVFVGFKESEYETIQ